MILRCTLFLVLCLLKALTNAITDAEHPSWRVTCPSDAVAVGAYPLRCDTYYVCVKGSFKLKQCARGYHFDEGLRACKPYTSVICGDRPGITDDAAGKPLVSYRPGPMVPSVAAGTADQDAGRPMVSYRPAPSLPSVGTGIPDGAPGIPQVSFRPDTAARPTEAVTGAPAPIAYRPMFWQPAVATPSLPTRPVISGPAPTSAPEIVTVDKPHVINVFIERVRPYLNTVVVDKTRPVHVTQTVARPQFVDIDLEYKQPVIGKITVNRPKVELNTRFIDRPQQVNVQLENIRPSVETVTIDAPVTVERPTVVVKQQHHDIVVDQRRPGVTVTGAGQGSLEASVIPGRVEQVSRPGQPLVSTGPGAYPERPSAVTPGRPIVSEDQQPRPAIGVSYPWREEGRPSVSVLPEMEGPSAPAIGIPYPGYEEVGKPSVSARPMPQVSPFEGLDLSKPAIGIPYPGDERPSLGFRPTAPGAEAGKPLSGTRPGAPGGAFASAIASAHASASGTGQQWFTSQNIPGMAAQEIGPGYTDSGIQVSGGDRRPSVGADGVEDSAALICSPQRLCHLPNVSPHSTFILGREGASKRSSEPWYRSAAFAPWGDGEERSIKDEDCSISFRRCREFSPKFPCDKLKENFAFFFKRVRCCLKAEYSSLARPCAEKPSLPSQPTTTKAPETTTTQAPETTRAPESTTQAPETTTQAPETTTQAPETTTTQAPEITTQAPETTTTQAPETTTTQAPETTTTQAPETTTTQAPETTTTQAPETTTTQAPETTTTQAPETTTQAPETTTTQAPEILRPRPRAPECKISKEGECEADFESISYEDRGFICCPPAKPEHPGRKICYKLYDFRCAANYHLRMFEGDLICCGSPKITPIPELVATTPETPAPAPPTLAPIEAPAQTPTPLPTTQAPAQTPTPLPTTQAPAQTPTPLPTTQAPAETPAPLPTTQAPGETPAPTSATPAPAPQTSAPTSAPSAQMPAPVAPAPETPGPAMPPAQAPAEKPARLPIKKIRIVRKCYIKRRPGPCDFGFTKMFYRGRAVCCSRPYRRRPQTKWGCRKQPFCEDGFLKKICGKYECCCRPLSNVGPREMVEDMEIFDTVENDPNAEEDEFSVQDLEEPGQARESSGGDVATKTNVGIKAGCHLATKKCEQDYKAVGSLCCRLGFDQDDKDIALEDYEEVMGIENTGSGKAEERSFDDDDEDCNEEERCIRKHPRRVRQCYERKRAVCRTGYVAKYYDSQRMCCSYTYQSSSYEKEIKKKTELKVVQQWACKIKQKHSCSSSYSERYCSGGSCCCRELTEDLDRAASDEIVFSDSEVEAVNHHELLDDELMSEETDCLEGERCGRTRKWKKRPSFHPNVYEMEPYYSDMEYDRPSRRFSMPYADYPEMEPYYPDMAFDQPSSLRQPCGFACVKLEGRRICLRWCFQSQPLLFYADAPKQEIEHTLDHVVAAELKQMLAEVIQKKGFKKESKADEDFKKEDGKAVPTMPDAQTQRVRGFKVPLKTVAGTIVGKLHRKGDDITIDAKFMTQDGPKDLKMSKDHLNTIELHLGKGDDFEIPAVLVTSSSNEGLEKFSLVNASSDTKLKIAEETDDLGRRSDVVIPLESLIEMENSFDDLGKASDDEWLDLE